MSPLVPKVTSVLTQHALSLLTITSIVWFALLCFIASLTPIPFVFGDEAGYFLPILYGFDPENYRLWSILPRYPDYLYFWIYSFLPSQALHTGAKILNAGFIAATAIPAYGVARRYLTTPYAAAFAAVVMLSPISSFVRYVMPEPAYFFGFWLVVLVVLSALDKSPLLSATAGGASIAALSLIKPHAFALALGIGAFFLMRDRFRIRNIAATVALFLTYYVTRVVLAFLLTGEWKWIVSSGDYSGMLSGYHINLSAAAYNAIGNTSAIITLIAVPLAITLVMVIRHRFLEAKQPREEVTQRLFDLGLLACCVLLAMVAMTIYFSQSVYQIDPEGEPITRLHGRYYLYVLPLFVLVTVGLWQSGIEISRLLSRWAIILLCGVMLAAATVIVAAFEPHTTDFPDLSLAVLAKLKPPFFLLLSLAAALALIYSWVRRIGITNLILGTIIWWTGLSLVTTATLMAGKVSPTKTPVDIAFLDSTDQSGLRSLVGHSDGLVIGSPTSFFDIYRTMFYLRSMSAGRIVPSGAEISDVDFPENAHWAVILPEVSYIDSSQVRHNGSLLVVRR